MILDTRTMLQRYPTRDLFVEAGYGPNFADQLIQNAYSKLFEGDPIDERIYFEASDDMAYIIDIGHDDIRSEGMRRSHVRQALELFQAICPQQRWSAQRIFFMASQHDRLFHDGPRRSS